MFGPGANFFFGDDFGPIEAHGITGYTGGPRGFFLSQQGLISGLAPVLQGFNFNQNSNYCNINK